MGIYKYYFEHEYLYNTLRIFKGSYWVVLFLLENYELLHCKDIIFYVIYHSLSIYHKAWHSG